MMDILHKFEKKVLSWFKSAPNLPDGARKWLGDNIWWITLIGLILTVVSLLSLLAGLNERVALLNSVVASYYTSSTVMSWAIVTAIVSSVFLILQGILLAMAIQPLKQKQKKGWVLLFGSWLVAGLAVVVSAVLTLSVFSFIINILFGAVWLAVIGYFLFEIHGQFAHVERSKGVKSAEKATK